MGSGGHFARRFFTCYVSTSELAVPGYYQDSRVESTDRRKGLATDHLAIVRKHLKPYVDRGVFRGFHESGVRGGKTQFSFTWLEAEAFIVVTDPKTATLTVRNVLPNVEPRSDLDQELRAYLKGRYDRSLPAHRRIDAGRAEVSLVNRGGQVSIVWKVKRNQYAYAVRRLLNLLNEIFVLLHTQFFEYMVENFDASQE